MEQPPIPQQYEYIPDSSYSIDKNGYVYKDGKPTICMFAPRIPVENKVQPLGALSGKQGGDFSIHTFACGTHCPKCNVLRVENPAQKNSENLSMVMGFVLQINCNGSIDQYDLPLPETQEPPKLPGMSIVK